VRTSETDYLGGSYSQGWGINNQGDVVGYSDIEMGITGNGHAFLYKRGTLYDLNSLLDGGGSGRTLLAANAINDAGQITGVGRVNGQRRAFLLTPVKQGSRSF
jgi:probable HAF family extracellular repeat protein